MITEIVTFDVPHDMTRDEVLRLFEQSAEIWRAHPTLHRKNYLFDDEARVAGGVYTWDTIEEARAAHDSAFIARVQDSFGSTPTFQYFETPIVVQNRPSM